VDLRRLTLLMSRMRLRISWVLTSACQARADIS